MITKYFIAKSDETDSGDISLQVLLNDKNELLETSEIDPTMYIDIGKTAYEDNDVKIIYAYIKPDSASPNWSYVPYERLNESNCKDFEAVQIIAGDLGFQEKLDATLEKYANEIYEKIVALPQNEKFTMLKFMKVYNLDFKDKFKVNLRVHVLCRLNGIKLKNLAIDSDLGMPWVFPFIKE